MNKRIIFRADGNEEISSGHIMRCLTIAEAAQKQGCRCWFVVAGEEMVEKIKEKGFPTFILNSDYLHMDDELNNFETMISQVVPDLVFIDSYFVTAPYLRQLNKHVRTAYIDDLADFAYPVDFLINYSIYADEINYASLYRKAKISLPYILSGSSYVPLRTEFQTVGSRRRSHDRKRILVTTGSSDPYHIILKMAEKVISCEALQIYEYHFIVGALCRDCRDIIEKFGLTECIRIHANVSSMSELMMECDIAVSAGGSTLYELCACEMPTISFIMADNQIHNVRTFEKRGIMLCAGDCRSSEYFIDHLFSMIVSLCENESLCRKLALRAKNAVEVNGADHIVNAIVSKI